MARLKKKVLDLLNKSRESAKLAISIYNNPTTVFRSPGYIVLMSIAWTSLFHAIFERDNVKYYDKDPNDRRKYIYIDGDKKAWELSKCIKYYFKEANNPMFHNISFFIGLRNKIEHRFIPQVDNIIFGECQSYLINYEEILVKEFGDKYSLADSLLFALQYSKVKTAEQIMAQKKVQSKHFKSIKSYIDNFRSNLDESILANPSFSLRVFLIPKPANHQSSADVTMEFVRFDPHNPTEMENYQRLVTLIKEKSVPTTISLASNESNLKDKLILVDRGNTSGATATVTVTHDEKKALGILVVEKLSDDIFNDAKSIADAATILQHKFNECLLSKKALGFIYANRHSITSYESIKVLLDISYNNYMPINYWITKLNPDDIKEFFFRSFKHMRYPWIIALLKVVIISNNNSWISYINDIASKYDKITQPPEWYWTWGKMIDKLNNKKGILSILDIKPYQEIYGHTPNKLIKDNALSEELLTKACLDFSNSEGNVEKYTLRELDMITYFNSLI